MKRNIHHGQLVEKKIRNAGISIIEVSRITKVNRRSLYNWFHKDYIRPEILMKIGRAIDYEFSLDIPDLDCSSTKIESERNVFEAYWKMKYLDLLKKYNDALLNNP